MQRRRGDASLLYAAPMLAVYAVFALGPLLYLAALSTVQWDGYGAASFVGLDNYRALWLDPGFGIELRHSLVWLVVTLAVPTAAGLTLALLLAVAPPRVRAIARALLLVPLLLPSAAIAVSWRLLYNPLSGPLTGLLDALGLHALAGDWLGDPRIALAALLLPACWAAFGFSMLVFGAALSAVDPAIVAAAQVDGAGAWARTRLITLPSLRGALPLAVVATALCAVPSLDLVLLTTGGGPGYATTILPLDMYGRAFGGGAVGAAAAIAVLQSAIGVALALAALALAPRAAEIAASGDEGLRPRVSRAARAGASVALTGAVALILFPLAWLLALAPRAMPGSPVPGSPASAPWVSLWQNMGAVWGNGFGAAFLTSLLTSVVVTLVTLALAAPAAFGLSRGRGVARAATLALLALGLFQPGAALIVPLFTLLKDMDLLNTLPGVIAPEVARALPVAVLLLWVALRALPAEVLAAAEVDGAAPRQLFARVALPLAAPMLAVAGLWAFVSSWNEYLLPTVVLQDESVQTVPVVLSHFVGRVDTQFPLLAGGALLATAPLLALYALSYGALAGGLRRLGGRAWR